MENINRISDEIEIILNRHEFYSDGFWRLINQLDKNQLSQYLIVNLNSYERIDFNNFKIILYLIQGAYPFDESNINQFRNALFSILTNLVEIDYKLKLTERDHLLYVIMDILFHHPNIISDSNLDQKNYCLKRYY